MVRKYPVPKEATYDQIRDAFAYSPTITPQQSDIIINDLMTLKRIKAAIHIYKLPSYTAEFLHEMMHT